MSLMNISIRRFYSLLIAVVFLLLLLILLLSIFAQYRRVLISQTEEYRRSVLSLANELENSSDELTQMARLYVATHNPSYKNKYEEILAIRDGKLLRPENYSSRYWDFILGGSIKPNHSGKVESFLDRLNKINLPVYEKSLLSLAYERSQTLNQIEKRALNAMDGNFQDASDKYTVHGKPDPALAISLLSSNEYLQAKDLMYAPINEFISALDKETSKTYSNLELAQRKILFVLILMIGMSIILVLFAYFMLTRHLRQVDILMEHISKIKLGNYQARNNLNSTNELGVFGKTLNQMCESVSENIVSLEKIANDLRFSEERFRSVIENSPYGISITNLNGKFMEVNDSLCEYLGYTRDELLKMGYQDVTDPKDLPIDQRFIKQLINGEISSYTRDKMHIRKDGSKVWASLSVSTIRNEKGEPQNLVGQILEITERIQNESALLELSDKMAITLKDLKQREKEQILLNKLNEVLQLCMKLSEAYPRIEMIATELFPHLSGTLSIYNKETEQLEKKLEWGENKIVTQTFSTMDCFSLRNGAPSIIENPTTDIPCEHYTSPPQGAYMGIPLIVLGEVIGVIHMVAAEGKSISKEQQQVVLSFSNVVKLALSNIKLLEALHEQSTHDPLTGLYNRRYLDEMLSRELQRTIRTKNELTVVMIDIDYFKDFNDNYGHEAGDYILKYFGKILSNNFRGSDIACRFGGEEFIIVLPDTNLKDATHRLQNIVNHMKDAHLFYNEKILENITMSIGVAVAPKDGDTVEKIIVAADHALYLAKESGRDRLVVYDSETINHTR